MADFNDPKWLEKQKRWFIQYRDKTNPKKFQKKFLSTKIGADQEQEARNTFAIWYGAYLSDKSLPVEKKPAEEGTIEFLAAWWLKYIRAEKFRKPKINTVRGYEQSITNWILADKSPLSGVNVAKGQLDILALRRFVDFLLSSELSPSSRFNHYLCLSVMLKDCTEEKKIGFYDNPFLSQTDKVKQFSSKFSGDKEAIRFITRFDHPQISTLLGKEVMKITDDRRVKYAFAYFTGARIEEIQGLIWNDLKLDNANPYFWIYRQLEKKGSSPFVLDTAIEKKSLDYRKNLKNAVVSLPKSKKPRIMAIHPMLLEVLTWWKNEGWKNHTGGRTPEGTDPIFPVGAHSLKVGVKSNDFSGVKDIAKTMRVDLERLGLPTTQNDEKNNKAHNLVFHSLRHSFSTALKHGGVAEDDRSGFLGHTPKTTGGKHYDAESVPFMASELNKIACPEKISLSRVIISRTGVEANVAKVISLLSPTFVAAKKAGTS